MGTEDTTAITQDANMVIQEAFEVSNNEAVSIVEEGLNEQSLAESFESYVQKYQDTWMSEWVDSIEAFENEVKDWQESVLKDFLRAVQPAPTPSTPKKPPSSSSTGSTPKPKS